MPRAIETEVIVPASLAEVWDGWTTAQGVATFLGPRARIELAVGGPYEIYFDPDARVTPAQG